MSEGAGELQPQSAGCKGLSAKHSGILINSRRRTPHHQQRRDPRCGSGPRGQSLRGWEGLGSGPIACWGKGT